MRSIEEIKASIQECSVTGTQKQLDGFWLEWFRAVANGIEPDRLEAICQAERDGRCVVLSVKVGDTVYTVDLDCEDNQDHTKMCFCWNKSCKSCEKAYLRVWENRTKTVDIRSIVAEMGLCGEDGGFGKTVFLTREAAEAALAKEDANAD